MKKIGFILILLGAFILVGCQQDVGTTNKLTDQEEEDILAKTEEIISKVHQGGFEEVGSYMAQSLKDELEASPGEEEKLLVKLRKDGDISGFEKGQAVSHRNPGSNEEIIVAQVQVNTQTLGQVYRLSFNSQGLLIGFYAQ